MRLGYKIITSIVIIVLLGIPSPCQGEENAENTFSNRKSNSLQKSLLVPGWGQFAEKHYIEGAIFLSAELFCLYGIFSNSHKSNDYYKKYKNATNIDDAIKFRELTEKHDTTRNKFILAAVAVWAINLIDIYVIVKNKKKKEKNLNIKLGSGENKSLLFTISYRF